jgi:transposase
MRPHQLRDDQWDLIRNRLPGRAGSVGVTAADNRRFIDAVIHRYRTGSPWRDLPESFGDWNNTHRRWSRWAKRGVWVTILALLAVDADNEYAMIDSTIVRAHQHSAGAKKNAGEDQAIGKSKGGLSTKIHVLVDALGNPLKIILTAGQVHDLAGADALVPGMEAEALLADKAYDADKRVIEPLEAAGKTAVIPPKKNRKNPRPYDKVLYEARHLMENFFCWAKQFRAIATRYDKTARNFLAAVHMVAALCWLN